MLWASPADSDGGSEVQQVDSSYDALGQRVSRTLIDTLSYDGFGLVTSASNPVMGDR